MDEADVSEKSNRALLDELLQTSMATFEAYNDSELAALTNTTMDYFEVDYPATQHPLNDDVYVLWSFSCSCIMLALCVFGIISNALSIQVFLNRKMRSPINAMLVALCCIDIGVVALAIPLLALHGLNAYVMSITLEKLIAYSVVYLYPLAMTAKTCSVWTFLLVTFERFTAVCHPLKERAFKTSKHAAIASCIVVAAAFLYNLIRYWEYSILCDENNQPLPVFRLRENKLYYRIYSTALYLITHFLCPFSALIVLNGRIISAISYAKAQRKQLSRQETREHRTARMLVIVILMFLGTNSLPFTLNLVEALVPELYAHANKLLVTMLLDVSNCLVILNSSVTIFIYYHYSSKFRVLFRLLYFPSNSSGRYNARLVSAQSAESIKDMFGSTRTFDQLLVFVRTVAGLIFNRRYRKSAASRSASVRTNAALGSPGCFPDDDDEPPLRKLSNKSFKTSPLHSPRDSIKSGGRGHYPISFRFSWSTTQRSASPASMSTSPTERRISNNTFLNIDEITPNRAATGDGKSSSSGLVF